MALRRDDACSVCGAALVAGTRAQWDSEARTVTCLPCVDKSSPGSLTPRPSQPGERANGADTGMVAEVGPPDEAAPPLDIGTPGASARREFERRKAKKDARIEQTWGTGRLGRIAKALSDDPQSTTAWAKGAGGEQKVALVLQEQLGDRAVLLHDRKVRGTRGNIDHLVIATSGVWIVDAKRYKGKVEKRDVGGWFKSDVRLYVGGRDRTKSVTGLEWQHDAVRSALGDESVPVHRALSFVGAEWPLFFARPFQLDGVWISWPKKLAELIGRGDAVIADDDIERIARHLAERMPAN